MKRFAIRFNAPVVLSFAIISLLVLVLAALTCVVGVVLVFRPMTGVRALTALMGLSLLCDGVLNLSVALCTVKIVDYQRPDVIETDDYEIGKDE